MPRLIPRWGRVTSGVSGESDRLPRRAMRDELIRRETPLGTVRVLVAYARVRGGGWLWIARRSMAGPIVGEGRGSTYEIVRAAVEEWMEQEAQHLAR
ncbi:MAG TPA: hypothetical protein VKV57_14555 [bacterium]|nr:hypothetical protein [bacterium]